VKIASPANALALLVSCAASAVAAWLNFRAGDNASAVRFGVATVPFDPHYPAIRVAWIVALAAAVIGVVLLFVPRPSRWAISWTALVVTAAGLVVASLIVSPAHFVAGTPRPVEMDPHRFDTAAWLCVAAAAAFLAVSTGSALTSRRAR